MSGFKWFPIVVVAVLSCTRPDHPDEARIAQDAAADSTAPEAAADVVRRFYAAIDAKNYFAAYALREPGATPTQTLDQFAAGFAQTVRADVDIGDVGRVEGAAGSRYVKVPVEVRAVTTNGENQRFEGTYTLRRSVVDGASADERHWRIYSGDLRQVR
jgi:hypothetical protein